MRLGTAFFVKGNSRLGVGRHLFFILSNPDGDNKVVMANVSTTPCPSGETCLVMPGDYNKVSEKSFLRFDKIKLIDRDKLLALLQNGDLQKTASPSADLIARLQGAILGSRSVPIEAREILRSQTMPRPK